MFDIGFWELIFIGVIAMLVIGPERLPGVAHKAGLWFGRARRFVTSVKADIDREIKAEELKRIMEEQKKSSGIHELIEETRRADFEEYGTDDYLVRSEKKPSQGESATEPRNEDQPKEAASDDERTGSR